MVQEGYSAIFAFPHLVLFPSAAIALLTLAFAFLGDGLRDALDPRTELLGRGNEALQTERPQQSRAQERSTAGEERRAA
jgi:hypothetical protein